MICHIEHRVDGTGVIGATRASGRPDDSGPGCGCGETHDDGGHKNNIVGDQKAA